MMELFAADVSYWQVPVNDEYKRRWLIFRGGDGSVDTNARQNLAWCERALADGRLLGYTIYWVYRPGDVDNILRYCDELDAPTDCHMMIDCESWGGQIGGNHSNELNKLAKALRKRQQGQSYRVWGYGNQNDLAHLWPSRPKWLRLVVAGYSNHGPALPRMVGWQYTDGEDRWPVPDGWPRASAPFGRCDHNRLYLTKQDIGDDMSLTAKQVTAAARDAIVGPDGKHHRIDTIVWFMHRMKATTDTGQKRNQTPAWYVVHGYIHALAARHVGNRVAKLAANIVKRVAALQRSSHDEHAEILAAIGEVKAEVAAMKAAPDATVKIEPTDVPVTGTVHIGEAK